jgi:site-specific DNA recombinase
MSKIRPTNNYTSKKRMALYARVSTQEQTKKDYPSCESQIEELVAHCRLQGWEVAEIIKDEGYSAGSLNRPGLTRIRSLVERGYIEGILCTWYDRLTRSREFYILDKEFRTHQVDFITLHDPTDRHTASGRFMEMMLVGAKAYEREQTGEKVSIKLRMRREKGLWNGGLVPFGFMRGADHVLSPDPDKSAMVTGLFQTYVETASEAAVRDWLKAHQIPAPNGAEVWCVGTIRDLLLNRRYIGEIEINPRNFGIEGLPENSAYRIVKAPHEPLVPVELFELAQAVRKEKATASPNRVGRPRSYSQNQCDRVFPLQSRIYCAKCGHSMTPYYVVHKPNRKEKRVNASYIFYYICAQQQMRGRHQCGHSNRVAARVPEAWIEDQIRSLVEVDGLVEQAVEMARMKSAGDLAPQQQALAFSRQAAKENEAKIDRLIESITSGEVSGSLLSMLNGKASELRLEQERLKAEQRQLHQELLPLRSSFDAQELRGTLQKFSSLWESGTPAERQRMVRTFVHRIEWHPEGEAHDIELYVPNKQKNQPSLVSEDWLESERQLDCPSRIRTSDPPVNSRLLYR